MKKEVFLSKSIIMPYHFFNYRGDWYLINIEDMHACSIDDEETVKTLKMLATKPNRTLVPHMKEQLKKLDLITEGQGQTQREVKKEVKKEAVVPVSNMALFLTQFCNLKCIYCYGGAGRYGTGGSMKEKTAFKAVDWLIEQSGKVKKIHVGFFGGEPFLNFPLMKAVVKYAQKRVQETEKEVAFYTTTNATLLDDEIIAFIKEHNVSFMISFDGPKEIQDLQRPFVSGKGSYDIIVPKIKKLLKVLPKTPGHAVITANTDPQMVINALQEIGFMEVSFIPVSISLFGSESDITKSCRITENVLRLMEQESEAWIRLTKNRDIESLKNLISYSQLYHGLILFMHNSKRYFPCGAGLGFVGVSCSGDVYLCHRFVGIDRYKLGSVFQKNLNREEYQKSPITITCNETCTDCFAKYYCAGGCKHDNEGSCGFIFRPSEDMCKLRRREVELAAYITSIFDHKDRDFLFEYKVIPHKPCPLDF